MIVIKNLFDEIVVHFFESIFRSIRVMKTERCFMRALSIMDVIIKVCSRTPEIFGVNFFGFLFQ